MKKLDRNGFAVVEGVVLVVLVAAIVGGGFYVWHKNHKMTPTPAKTAVSSKSTAPVNPKKSSSSSSDLVVSQWNAEISMQDASKVTYTYNSTPGKTDPLVNSNYDSSINLEVKSEYLQNKSCKVSVAMFRSSVAPAAVLQAKDIGGYYYWTSGSPYSCGNKADDSLNQTLRSEFSVDNLQKL